MTEHNNRLSMMYAAHENCNRLSMVHAAHGQWLRTVMGKIALTLWDCWNAHLQAGQSLGAWWLDALLHVKVWATCQSVTSNHKHIQFTKCNNDNCDVVCSSQGEGRNRKGLMATFWRFSTLCGLEELIISKICTWKLLADIIHWNKVTLFL